MEDNPIVGFWMIVGVAKERCVSPCCHHVGYRRSCRDFPVATVLWLSWKLLWSWNITIVWTRSSQRNSNLSVQDIYLWLLSGQSGFLVFPSNLNVANRFQQNEKFKKTSQSRTKDGLKYRSHGDSGKWYTAKRDLSLDMQMTGNSDDDNPPVKPPPVEVLNLQAGYGSLSLLPYAENPWTKPLIFNERVRRKNT